MLPAIVIFSGTSGIGFAIAEAFLENGAEVFITGHNGARLEKACDSLVNKCGIEERVHGIVMDNRNPNVFSDCINAVIAELKGRHLSILVNNAEVIRGNKFGSVVESEYDQTMDTNLKGTYFLSQMVAEYMKREKVRGNILNIASSSSLRPAISPYTMSKWGIRGLTLGLAKTLIPYDIVVNGVAPGPTATPLLLGNDTDHLENDYTPNGRYAAPEEIANMAVILTSELGRTIIGDIVYMTCGSGVITYDDMKY